MSNLMEHARRELQLAGVEPELQPSLLAAVEGFVSYGHSGTSAQFCVEILGRLLRFENLTPLGTTPDEWMHIAGPEAGVESVWQNRRRSTSFSRDGGTTWYDIDDPSQNNGDSWGFGCPITVGGLVKTHYRHFYPVSAETDGLACLDCGRVDA